MCLLGIWPPLAPPPNILNLAPPPPNILNLPTPLRYIPVSTRQFGQCKPNNEAKFIFYQRGVDVYQNRAFTGYIHFIILNDDPMSKRKWMGNLQFYVIFNSISVTSVVVFCCIVVLRPR